MSLDTIDYEREYFILLDKYNELIYAVARKFDNESRHQTALRYINEIENQSQASQETKTITTTTPWVEPKFERREWNATPIVPEQPKS